MKASRKVSLIYSFITIGFVIIAGMVFYVFFSHRTENLYYHYLEEKARTVAAEKFQKDELDPVKYRNVVMRRQNSIPTSKEIFINLADKQKANQQLSKYLDDSELLQLFQNKVVNFRKGNLVGTSFIYYDNEGTFAVIVLSLNPYGDELASNMRWMILALVLIATGILYLISRLYATRMVDKIDKAYQTEKMFVNNASHEINNPLTAIQGECEIALMKERTPDEYKNSLQRISDETDRVIRIMQQLLLFSHTRSENDDIENLDKISIASFVQQFADASTLVKIHDDFTIFAREDLLTIALRNIVSNARKYSAGKPVTITISKKVITIADLGIGIPEKNIKHIFDPFYRASNTSGITGNGIGLSLAKEILGKYKAKISVKSKEQQGTIFTIKFHT